MAHPIIHAMIHRLATAPAGLLLLAALLCRAEISSAQVQVLLTERDAVRHALGDAERVRTLSFKIDEPIIRLVQEGSGVPFKAGWTHCFQGSTKGKVVAYACIDNMIGKERPITYIVRINHPEGTIGLLEVMEYREAIGAEVNSPGFRGQFTGKGAGDPVRLHQDIHNLQGATLSARGLTNGARKILHLYEAVLREIPAQ